MPGGITVRSATDLDTEALAELYRAVFAEMSADRVRWLQHVPSGHARRLLAFDGDRLVGHVGAIGLPAFFDGVLRMTAGGAHWMVDGDYRGRGVGRALTDIEDPDWADAVVSFAVDSTIPVIQGAYQEYRLPLGRVPAWSAWRRPDAVSQPAVARLSRPALGAVLKLAAGAGRAGRGGTRGLRLKPGWPDDAALDELAQRSAAFAGCIRLRDAAHIRWRWTGGAEEWCFAHALDRTGRLRGWVVYGMPADEPVGQIVDLLVDGPRALRALVSLAADDLAARGAGLVFLRLLDPRRWVTPALLAAGFLRRGTGPYVVVRAVRPDLEARCTDRASWYLTAGDADRL